MEDMTKCPACETDVSEQAATCPKCGHPLPAKAKQQAEATVRVIVILAIVFGIIAFGGGLGTCIALGIH